MVFGHSLGQSRHTARLRHSVPPSIRSLTSTSRDRSNGGRQIRALTQKAIIACDPGDAPFAYFTDAVTFYYDGEREYICE